MSVLYLGLVGKKALTLMFMNIPQVTFLSVLSCIISVHNLNLTYLCPLLCLVFLLNLNGDHFLNIMPVLVDSLTNIR